MSGETSNLSEVSTNLENVQEAAAPAAVEVAAAPNPPSKPVIERGSIQRVKRFQPPPEVAAEVAAAPLAEAAAAPKPPSKPVIERGSIQRVKRVQPPPIVVPEPEPAENEEQTKSERLAQEEAEREAKRRETATPAVRAAEVAEAAEAVPVAEPPSLEAPAEAAEPPSLEAPAEAAEPPSLEVEAPVAAPVAKEVVKEVKGPLGREEAQQLINEWKSEGVDLNIEDPETIKAYFEERNKLITKMKGRVFPKTVVNEDDDTGGLYPDVDDPEFLNKLLGKREFAELKQESIFSQLEKTKKNKEMDLCDPEREFELTAVQRFVSRLLSPQTPYKSALLYHGVGVGKTCAAISIAEGYLEQYPSDKVLIVAPPNIQSGFVRTIFDPDNLELGKSMDEPNTARGCTGNTYLYITDTYNNKEKTVDETKADVTKKKYESERRKEIIRKVDRAIKSRYNIQGYISFKNYIESIEKQIINKDPVLRKAAVNKQLQKEFNGRVIIIDEAHNLRDNTDDNDEENLDAPGGMKELEDSAAGKKLTPFLRNILNVCEGITLVLLTGTPMYNSNKEIIFLLNLLLMNDKQPEEKMMKDNEDFIGNKLTKKGETRLSQIASRYVSFMRGENPMTFPVRLEPQGIEMFKNEAATPWPTEDPSGKPINEGEGRDTIVKLPLVPCRFEGGVADEFKSFTVNSIRDGGLGIQNSNKLVQAGNWIYPGNPDEGETSIEERIRSQGFDSQFQGKMSGQMLRFTSRYGTPTWLLEENLSSVSPKMKTVLQRLRNTRGCAFIYSRFVKAGALSIALALEANGYQLFDNEDGLLTNKVGGDLGGQCALCPMRRKGHMDHTDPLLGPKEFVQAKYVLLTGTDELSPNNANSVKNQRAKENKYGKNVKVVIGSQVAGEGIDLRFIREIFLFDSWFHLNKMEQVVGRGIRNCSHNLLDEKDRNCTVYLLVNSFTPDFERETMDMYTYRKAFLKAKEVGDVSRILKRSAIDCNLNRDAIIVKNLPPIPFMWDGQNKKRENVQRNDVPFTFMTDWATNEEETFYRCYEPIKISKNPNERTYNEYAARWQEQKIRNEIRRLFEENNLTHVSDDDLIKALEKEYPQTALYSVLSSLIDDKSFKVHVNGRNGYITYRNTLYLFQPDDLKDLRVPLALRLAHYPVKKDFYSPSDISILEGQVLQREEQLAQRERVANADDQAFPEGENDFWNEMLKWIDKIKRGENYYDEVDAEKLLEIRLEKSKKPKERKKKDIKTELDFEICVNPDSTLKIPKDVCATLIGLHKDEKKLIKRSKERLDMIDWFYIQIGKNPNAAKRAEDYQRYATILKELIWDEFLALNEQKLLAMNPKEEDKHIYKDSFVTSGNTSAFRYVNTSTGELIYLCGEKKCTDPIKKLLEGSESNKEIRELIANKTTTGEYYGFIVPKKQEMIFKIGEPPAVGKRVEKGQECAISSAVPDHIRKLKVLGTVLKSGGSFDYGLNEDVLEGASTMAIHNATTTCFLTDIVLRFMNEKKINGKAWFYRSIRAHAIGQKGAFEKTAAAATSKANV
jgi:hypothetical protein